MCTYSLKMCLGPPESGHHHYPSTEAVAACSLDETSMIHCSSLSQLPAMTHATGADIKYENRKTPTNINLQRI